MKELSESFSVLMSVYKGEEPSYLFDSINSIYFEQTLKPQEIVLVKDGPLTDELYVVIQSLKDKLGDVLVLLQLEENVGLGRALQYGLQRCTNEIVARMDSDDLSVPNRFEKQLHTLKMLNVDVCGSWVSEFFPTVDDIYSMRKVPENHNEIISFATERSPMNHPSVMFKKSAVLKHGSYSDHVRSQDYYLWVRMIQGGALFYNIPSSLVLMRGGPQLLSRRSGLKYALNEAKIFLDFYKMGFIGLLKTLKNIIIRFTVRILPELFLKLIYKRLRT